MSSPESSGLSAVAVGFFPRLLAEAVDTVLWVILILAVMGDPAHLAPESRLVADWLFPAALTLMCWTLWQATPGRMMIRARIVDAETGAQPTFGQYVLRYFGYFVALLPLGLGFLWMFFDARKRGLHDVIAGTMVARTAAAPHLKTRDVAASAEGAAAPTGRERMPVPRIFPGGFGPWGRAAAREGHASLLWIRDDVLFIAAVDRQNHPGAMAAVSAGDPFPGRAIPLGALHSVAGLADAADAEITFAVEDGSSETMAAALASPAERDELMGALLTRMGSGWARMVEREARGPLLWEGLKAAAAILVVTVVILGVISTGNVDSLQTEGRGGLVLAVLVVLGVLAGAKWVIGIAGALTGLCALYMIAVVAAPPERVALRRAAGARELSGAHPRAVYG